MQHQFIHTVITDWADAIIASLNAGATISGRILFTHTDGIVVNHIDFADGPHIDTDTGGGFDTIVITSDDGIQLNSRAVQDLNGGPYLRKVGDTGFAIFTHDGTTLGSVTAGSLYSLTITVDAVGAANSENLLSPMPSTLDAAGRNKINDAGLTTVTACTNVGAAAVGQANLIASESVPTAGSGPSLYLTHFVADDLSADPTIIVTSVFGAYDQVCNSTGSCSIASPHSMVKYSLAGHNNIFGGAANLVSGTTGLSAIFGGENNQIHDSTYGIIIGGKNTGINGGTYSAAIGCNGAVISSTTSLHVGGNGTYSGTGNITNGGVATCSGTYSIVGGLNAAHSGASGLTVGDNVNNAKAYATMLGKDGVALAPSSLTLSGTQITTKGDVTYCTRVVGCQSTDGSQQPMIFVEFPAGVNCAGTVTLSLTGKIVGTDSVISYCKTFAFWMNGDSYTFADSTGSGLALYRDVDVNIGGLTLSGGNAGKVNIVSVLQWLFIYTPGFTNVSTTVKWVGTAQITLTREDTVT